MTRDCKMSHQPNNIFAGTQVVSLVEVRGPSNSLVHPRGAVGVVTRTPAVEGEKFLVRFPDGFEKSLEHSQIEVLKHFKDRLGDGSQSSDFDLESVIIYRCVVGSRAYGLDNDESDTDRRGIYLAPAELQWSLFGAPEQFEDNADAKLLLGIAEIPHHGARGQPEHPGMLVFADGGESHAAGTGTAGAPPGIPVADDFPDLQRLRHVASSKRSSRTSAIRAKCAGNTPCTCCACCLTGAATLREGRVPVRVEAHRDRLLAVKRGELPWAEVDAWRKELHRDFETRPGRNQTARTPRLRSGESLPHQSAAENGKQERNDQPVNKNGCSQKIQKYEFPICRRRGERTRECLSEESRRLVADESFDAEQNDRCCFWFICGSVAYSGLWTNGRPG